MRLAHITVAVGGLALSLLSCRASTELDPVLERRPGVISLGSAPSVTVSTEDAVGVAILLSVITWGGGCVRQGDTEAHVVGLTADVTPYDSVYVYLPPRMACTSDLRAYTHQTRISFATPGVATVRVNGRAEPGSSAITVERTIQIH